MSTLIEPAGAPGPSSYVPAWLLREAGREDCALEQPGGRRLQGALLMADVSGFTRLAEKLRVHGSEGAEILWRQVDGYFGRMMEIINAHGGEVLRFPGDAAIVLFHDELDTADALKRAAACGVSLQTSLGTYPTEDGGYLRMRVAITAGEVLAAWVGGALGRWEAIVVGPPVAELGGALKVAEIGDVILSREAAPHVPSGFEKVPVKGGHLRLVATSSDLPPSLPPAPLPAELEARIRPFVPKAVLDRVDAGHATWMAELRNLSVLIASIHGIEVQDSLDPEVVGRLQGAFSAMQDAVYRYGGSVNLFLQDDKGIIMVAAWGLPGRAHEDDAVRAVRAAMHMRGAVESIGLALSVGVAQGKVFCGQRGGWGRLEYGVLGSTVNLAARLAGQTVGGILCSPQLRALARQRVRFSRGPELELKGMPEPVQAWLPTPVHQEATSSHRPVFGREAELSVLGQILDEAEDGRGCTVIVEGEPGIGKSSLLRAMTSDLEGRELRLLHGAADSIDRQTAYHAFRGVFEEIIGIRRSQTPKQRLQQAQDWLSRHPDVGELAPLFGPLLGVGIRDTPRTASMVGQARAETAIEAYVSLLEALWRPVIVIDDIQWLDSASWQLLKTARKRLESATFVLTTRPASAYPSEAYDALRAEEGVRHLPLGPLSTKAIDELVANRLGARAAGPALRQLVEERCEGLPFYAEEVAIALRDDGQLDFEDGVAELQGGVEGTSPVLPATLEGIITSRVDRLSATQQLAIKAASVIGRTFLADCVYDIYPVEIDAHQLSEELSALVSSDLIEVASVEPSLSYRFKHIITQEVAYELLLYEQRRGLHREVAEWLESGKAGDPSVFIARIAWHWQHTGDEVRAMEALEAAGEQAFGTFAEKEAVAFLGEALTLAEKNEVQLEVRRQARWQRVMGEAHMRLGHLEVALRHLMEANSLLGYPVPGSDLGVGLRLMREIFRQMFRHMGWSKPSVADDPHTRLDAVHAHLELSLNAYFLRKIPLVLYGGGRGLNLAQDVGPSPDLARALAQWAVIMSGLPLHKAAESYSLQALEIAEQFDDRYSLGNAQHYRGIIDLTMGRWQAANEILAKAQESYGLVGNGRRVQEATNSIVFACCTCGDLARAERELVRLREIAEARSDEQALFWDLVARAELAWRRGHGPEILDGVDESESNDEVFVVKLQGTRVLLLLQAGQLDAAEAALAPLEKLARPTSFIENLGYFALFRFALEAARAGRGSAGKARKRLKQLRGFAKIFPMGGALACLAEAELTELQGDRGKAAAAWASCLEQARALGCTWEQAQAHEALARLGEGEAAEEHRQAAQELSARMGLDPRSGARAQTA